MEFREHVPLAPRTTFKLGGAARLFAVAETTEELLAAIAHAHTRSLPPVVLGGGSNVLVPDAGLEALVVACRLLGVTAEDLDGDHVRVIAGAGESWDGLVAHTVARGWWGIENLSAIPGTVGGTPIQNVGAYGVEVSHSIEWVEAIDTKRLELVRVSAADCAFGYRDSYFKHSGSHLVVTRVAFLLSAKPKPILGYKDLAARFAERDLPALQEVRDAVCAIRRAKFPDLMLVGTAGSFFKNPTIAEAAYARLCDRVGPSPSFRAGDARIKIPAAFLLERCGWKGVRRGNVGTWPSQPLVLVHYGGGTTAELLALAGEIERDVLEKTEVALEREVRVLGGVI